MNWQFNGPGDVPPGPGTPYGYDSTFYAYCAELTEAVQANQTIEILSTDLLIPTSPVGSGNAFSGKKAAWLFNTYAPGINGAVNDLDSRQNAAALQVAIWEAIYDTSNNLSDGFFRLNSVGNIATKAMDYTYVSLLGCQLRRRFLVQGERCGPGPDLGSIQWPGPRTRNVAALWARPRGTGPCARSSAHHTPGLQQDAAFIVSRPLQRHAPSGVVAPGAASYASRIDWALERWAPSPIKSAYNRAACNRGRV